MELEQLPTWRKKMQLDQELTLSKEPTPNRLKINTKDKPLKIKY